MKILFDRYVLDTARMQLLRDDEPVGLEPQVYALLELLAGSAGRVVSRQEINDRIWGSKVVTEASIDSRMRSLRNALDDSGASQRLIATVRGVGFRFLPEVTTHVETGHVLRAVSERPAARDSLTGDKPRIAVVPLRLTGEDTRLEPLADAIAHELIADLSRLRWLDVISRGSTFLVRRCPEDQIAALLDVPYVLTGSLAVLDGRAQVGISLSHAPTGRVVWAEHIDCTIIELMTLRGPLVQGISSTIEHRLQDEEASRSEHLSTENLTAWMAFFRGIRHANRFNSHDNEIARMLFDRAIAEDPTFALAHAGLSFTYFQNAFVRYTDDADRDRDRALAAAEKAFELDPLDAAVNLSVGRARYLRGDIEQAEPWFERATELNPCSALAHYNTGLVHVMTGQTDDIEHLIRRATSMSPLDPLSYAFLGTRAFGHLFRGDAALAADWSERAANAPLAHHLIDLIAMVCAANAGDLDRARSRRDRAVSRHPDCSLKNFLRAFPVREQASRRSVEEAFALMSLA